MRILICDDKPSQCERTRKAIDSRGDVEELAGSRLKNGLTSLFGNVSGVLNGSATTDKRLESTDFDGFDLIIVDNNLTGLELDGARLTAETIIGYLRAFTDVPYIVSLNKNLHVDFDLRHLFGDYQSLADLALNTEHLSNGRLWDGNAGDGFAPWYWPRVADAAARRREQIDFIAKNFERPVWEGPRLPAGSRRLLVATSNVAAFVDGKGGTGGVLRGLLRLQPGIAAGGDREVEGAGGRRS